MPDPRLRIKTNGTGLDVAIHVQSRSRRSEIVGLHDGALKLKVTAPPVDDAANRAVIQFFAALLDIPKSHIRIASGDKSRVKILHVEGLSRADFLTHLPADLT